MKKVLLLILAGMFAATTALALPSMTIGVGINKGVFAAEGKEDNFDGSGSLAATTVEYGAFEDTYGSIYVEFGNETASIGLSYQDDVSTPTNVNEVGGAGSQGTPTSTVSATFQDVMTLYGLVMLPKDFYLKAGIVDGDIQVNEVQKSGNTYADQDLEGYVLGFGVQKEASGANVRLELLGHSYDDVSATNGVATTGNHNKITISDMIGANAHISINKTF